MDFTPELLGFQGVIISADNVYSFSKLAAKGGNEEKIEYVINSMLQFLEKQNYVNNKKEEIVMRKFALFLVLNAEITVLEDMVHMEGIDMIVWTIPTISKYLLSEMLWNLHMKKFVYEIISFCNPQLAIEVASTLIDNMKYYTPSSCQKKIKIVLAAIYRLLCRLHLFTFDNSIITNILSCLYDMFQQCLKYFITPPNAGKLTSLSKDELYKYKGNCLQTMLTLIIECFEQFLVKQDYNFDEVYLLTFQVDLLSAKDLCRSQDILEYLDKFHVSLLDKCRDLVMDVSVDIFCAWSEFEEGGKSMQQTIGELCYQLRIKLLSVDSVSEHPLVTMIQQIECKPINIEEIIKFTDTDTIIYNIQNNSNRAEWIHALIHTEKLCHNVNMLQHVNENFEVFNKEECYILYRLCQNYLKNYTENRTIVELLSCKAFQHCAIDMKNVILEERFAKNCFYDMVETDEFCHLMIEIFNKFVAKSDADISDILNIFIQSPQNVFMKIFDLATENCQQTEIMVRVMKFLEKYSNHYYNHETEPCLITITQKILDNHLDTEAKVENFIKFINDLKNVNIISGSKFLRLIIMPNLHNALLNNATFVINTQCQMLSQVFTLAELLNHRAPMLVMMAQVLETVRWKINIFSTLGPSTLELVLQLQTKLFDTYDDGIPEEEAIWLRSKLENMQPLNYYYFRKLWNTPHLSYLESVTRMTINKTMDFSQLAAWLSLILCSSTQSEWCSIWDSLALFDDRITLHVFYKNLVILQEIEVKYHTENSWGCLLNCYKNFVFIIRYKFFKEPLNDTQILAVIQSIVSLTNLIEDNYIEDIEPVLLPLLAYMVERKMDYTTNVALTLSNTLKHSKVADVVNKVLNGNDGTVKENSQCKKSDVVNKVLNGNDDTVKENSQVVNKVLNGNDDTVKENSQVVNKVLNCNDDTVNENNQVVNKVLNGNDDTVKENSQVVNKVLNCNDDTVNENSQYKK